MRRTDAPPPPRPGRGRSLVVSYLALVLLSACAQTTRQEVLEFFFDGVPPLEPLEATEDAETEEVEDPLAILEDVGPAGSRHRPYAEQRCTECHDLVRGMRVRTIEDGLCSSCHAALTAERPFLHGPVAADACLHCHVPHQSEFEHLLTAEATTLCLRCHATDDLRAPYHPAELEAPENACTACHDPHGGSNGKFLKPGAPRPGR